MFNFKNVMEYHKKKFEKREKKVLKNTICLAEELTELGQLLMKLERGRPVSKEDLVEETGDVLFHLIGFIMKQNLDPRDIQDRMDIKKAWLELESCQRSNKKSKKYVDKKEFESALKLKLLKLRK